MACEHHPPASFQPGEAVTIALATPSARESAQLASIHLHYRRINQAEAYQLEPMQREAGRWTATIPAAYSQSAFPLQYFFELRGDQGQAWLYPGFESNLCNQPYFVIHPA